MNPQQKILVGLASVVLFAGLYAAPYFAAYQATHAAIHSAEAAQSSSAARAQAAQVEKAEANIQAVVDYIKNVQTGPAAAAARNATGWYEQEFWHICRALPHCRNVPLPAGLK